MPTASVRGIRMRWEERGDGAPVILLHGIPTSPALWRKVMPLVPDARLIAWEMVGYGESIPEGIDREIGVARQARYLRAWMEDQAIDRAVLVGHDLGGGVAQVLAVDDPDRVESLLLTNSIGYDSWPVPAVKAMRTLGSLLERVPDRLFEPAFTQFLALGHDNAEVGRESAELHWRPYARHGGARAFIHQVRSLDVEDTLRIAGTLPQVHVPTRVVWGTDDRFQPLVYGERLAWDLDTPLDRIEGGRHFTPEDHPERIARSIQDLVDTVKTTPRRKAAVSRTPSEPAGL